MGRYVAERRGHTPLIGRQIPFIGGYVTLCERVHKNAANQRIIKRFAA